MGLRSVAAAIRCLEASLSFMRYRISIDSIHEQWDMWRFTTYVGTAEYEC